LSTRIEELGIALLDLDEGYMLMNCLAHRRIALMVVLHKHLEARVWHSEVVGELFGVTKFGREYVRGFALHLLFEFFDLLLGLLNRFAISRELCIHFSISCT